MENILNLCEAYEPFTECISTMEIAECMIYGYRKIVRNQGYLPYVRAILNGESKGNKIFKTCVEIHGCTSK